MSLQKHQPKTPDPLGLAVAHAAQSGSHPQWQRGFLDRFYTDPRP